MGRRWFGEIDERGVRCFSVRVKRSSRFFVWILLKIRRHATTPAPSWSTAAHAVGYAAG